MRVAIEKARQEQTLPQFSFWPQQLQGICHPSQWQKTKYPLISISLSINYKPIKRQIPPRKCVCRKTALADEVRQGGVHSRLAQDLMKTSGKGKKLNLDWRPLGGLNV